MSSTVYCIVQHTCIGKVYIALFVNLLRDMVLDKTSAKVECRVRKEKVHNVKISEGTLLGEIR